MLINNQRAREIIFLHWNELQKQYNQMVKQLLDEKGNHKQGIHHAGAFLKDFLIPYLDDAKDAIIREMCSRLVDVNESITKLEAFLKKGQVSSKLETSHQDTGCTIEGT